MNSTLTFERMTLPVGSFGEKSCLPDLIGQINVQNRTRFALEESDEIFEGFGQVSGSYPYPQRIGYTRELQPCDVRTAVIENKYLKAVFLLDFGGRLWELTDKLTGENLLYTNDVLRASNLAICSAWFSGGVEWNIGMIGHSPFTTEPLFTATLQRDTGVPVLRLYEYERVRGVTFQMDFWLENDDRFLNCRIRLENTSSQTVPMYWWTNIAVPEHVGGRIAVPATCAYTQDHGVIRKTSIPLPDGEDVSFYCEIPGAVDYFFNVPKTQRKYIANFNAQGYGLLQLSSNRLQGRKLFSWGHTPGSLHWQEFLTLEQGPYIEIQAGLGKTQYGCLPMPAHTAWEWIEQYGPISVPSEVMSLGYTEFTNFVTQSVEKTFEVNKPEYLLSVTSEMAKQPARRISTASPFGELANACREASGERPLPRHLDFSIPEEPLSRWSEFLRGGKLEIPSPQTPPTELICEDAVFEKLRSYSKTPEGDNWYVWYHLGLLWLYKKDEERAEMCFRRSVENDENAWALHALSCLSLKAGDFSKAVEFILSGYAMESDRLDYVMETFKILMDSTEYEQVIRIYSELSPEMREVGRLKMLYIMALSRTGKYQDAMSALEENGGIVVADMREGEDSLAALYQEIYKGIYGHYPEMVPHKFDFRMFA